MIYTADAKRINRKSKNSTAVSFEVEANSLDEATHKFTFGMFDKGDTATYMVELNLKTIKEKKEHKP